ncbi:DUF5694 domain-containing protein [Halocola ammonii]
MKSVYRAILVSLVGLFVVGITYYLISAENLDLNQTHEFLTYDGIPKSEVLVVGTYHFDSEMETDELSSESQQEIERLLDALGAFQPTKIFIEVEPEATVTFNQRYRDYLRSEFEIKSRPNEIYQLGFRLARNMGHDSIFLFDNQTEFIGSLENFSFSSFFHYADSLDAGYYDRHLEKIKRTWSHNDSTLKSLPLYDRIRLMNSSELCSTNAQRMHMLELRVGIGESWVGADWLARFYQRNIRMMGNVLKSSTTEDRIIIIVGANHKWILDQLFENTPDFKVMDIQKYL